MTAYEVRKKRNEGKLLDTIHSYDGRIGSSSFVSLHIHRVDPFSVESVIKHQQLSNNKILFQRLKRFRQVISVNPFNTLQAIFDEKYIIGCKS